MDHSKFAAILAIATFLLSLMGTFLVRSGILTSVHAFAADPARGVAILLFLTLLLFYAIIRFSQNFGLFSETSSKTPIYPKSPGVLLGAYLLILGCFVVMLGTLYPLVSEAIFNNSLSIGIPYFNKTFVPIAGLFFVVFMITMQKNRLKIENFGVLLLLLTLVVATIFIFIYGLKDVLCGSIAALGLWICILSIKDFYRGITWQRLPIFLGHFGLGIAVLGMALTSVLSKEFDIPFKLHEKKILNGYAVIFDNLESISGANYHGISATFKINHFILTPQKRLYQPREQVMTETSIKPGFLRDIYVSLGDQIDDTTFAVRIHFKPFVRWIWMGAILIGFGAILRGHFLLVGKNYAAIKTGSC